MQILSLKASGIAGQTFTHELAPVTVITGANAKGKTTRLNALLFGLVGYVPWICSDTTHKPIKTNSGIFEVLATSSQMKVTMELAPDDMICRDLISANGSVKMNYNGPEIQMPPVMIDAGEFMNLSERERVKFVFARTSANGDRRKVASTILANIKSIKLDPHTADAEQVIDDIAAEIGVKILQTNWDGKNINDIVEEVFSDLSQKKRDADAGVKRLTKAKEAMTHTAGDELPPPADCEKQLSDRQTLLATVNKEIGQHNQAIRSIGEEHREVLAAQLKLSTEEGQRNELAALQMLEQKGRKELGAKPVDPSLEQYNKLQEELGRNDRKVELAFQAWNEKDRGLRQLESDLETLNDPNSAKCSKCGSDLSATRDNLLAVCKTQLEQATGVVQPLAAAHQQAMAERDRVKGLVEAEMTAYQAANKILREWNSRNQNLTVLERRIATTKTALAANDGLREKVAKLADIEIRLANARRELSIALASAEKLTAEISVFQKHVHRLHQLRGKAQERAKIDAEADLQQVQADVLKAAVAMMDELRAKLVEAAITPLLTTLNRFSAGMLPRPLTYQDGRIGCAVNGSFVEKTLSGAEKAVALGAISVALAAESPLKILILDELTRLDVDNKRRFVERMLELVREGVIHQCIMTDTDARPYLTDLGNGFTDEVKDEKHRVFVSRWSESDFKLIKL